MKKIYIKILAFCLIIALVMQVTPMVSADGKQLDNIAKFLKKLPEETTSAQILNELTELRTQNTKYFQTNSGTIQAAEYAIPVHFYKNDKWLDYDNTLKEIYATGEDGESSKGKDLTNQNADYSIRLSKKTNDKKFVRVEKDGYKLSWFYKSANKSEAKIVRDDSSENDPLVLEKLVSHVNYLDVYDSVDFEYAVSPIGLKENIILKSNKSQTVFHAVYKSNGLTPVQKDNKTIVLLSEEGTNVYTLCAPFMEDTDGAISEDVSLELKNIENNKFGIDIILNEKWLSSSKRTYPVTVDPVLMTAQDISAARSAFVSSANPNKCYLASGTDEMGSLYVGNFSGFGQTESYIKFTSLPTLGIADKVVDARVYLALRKCEVGLTVNVKRLNSSWDPYTVKWNNKPTSEGIIKDYMALTPYNGATQFQSVEITDLVRGWYSGEYTNYGISLTTDKTTSCKAWFYSIYYTGYTSARPIMTVTYRNMTGYEDYWSYTSVSTSKNGLVSVNNYNGNIIFSQPLTISSGGNLMPVDLTLTYNSNGVNAPYTYLARNMRTNFHIYLTQESGQLYTDGYHYYLTDADGTKHWFYFENTTTNIGKDEDGLGYTLELITQNSDSICPNATMRITDKDKTKMYFNNSGRLIQITNANGVSATVSYETVSNTVRIQKVTDGAGRNYTFGYHELYPYLCESVTDPAGRTTSFEFWNGFLTKIIFPDSKNYRLYYTDEILSWVQMYANGNIYITHDSTSQKRATQLSFGTSDTNLIEKYNFSYKQNETVVTDLQNRPFTYQFNDYAQTTGVVSNTDGTAQFYEYTPSGNSTTANKCLKASKTLNTVTNYVINPGLTRNYTGFWTYAPDSTGSPTITVDATKGNFTKNSIKVYKPSNNTNNVMAVQNVAGLPAGTYTLSGYVNTGGVALAGTGSYFGIEIRNSAGTMVTVKKAEPIIQNNTWDRVSITFTLPVSHTLTFVMGFDSLGSHGTVWFDDIQLEKGAGMSSFNLVENSGITNGKTGWPDGAYLGSAGNLPGFNQAVYRAGDSTNPWLGISQYILTNEGTAGDIFSFGSWVKANAAPIENGTKTSMPTQYHLAIHFYNASGSWHSTQKVAVNADLDTWQFVAGKAIAPINYSKICIELMYYYNVNTFGMAGAFCYKEEFGTSYTHDSNGNVVSVSDLAQTNSTFKYYSNQMQQMIDPSGNRFYYHYEPANLHLNLAVSNSGQAYEFDYDNKGNPTQSKTDAWKPAQVLETGKSYIIVNAYSGLCIDGYVNGNPGDIASTYIIRRTSTKQHWALGDSDAANGIYTLKCAAYDDRYLDVAGNSSATGTALQIWYYNATNAQKFKLVPQSDGTFAILTASSDYTKAADGQYDAGTSIEMSKPVKQAECTISNLKESQKWYFYPVETNDTGKIVSTAAYTANQNRVSLVTDALGHTTSYSYNDQNGNLDSVTDAANHTTNYTYDANTGAVTSVSAGSSAVGYTYTNDRLTSIGANSELVYDFTYDGFGRSTGTTVGNGTQSRSLATNEYNSAGLLSKQTYGNGDYVEYQYDSLDRITQKWYNGDTTNKVVYYYGSNGKLSYTVDFFANTYTKYIYDLAGRNVEQITYSGTDLTGINRIGTVKYSFAEQTGKTESIAYTSAVGNQSYQYTYGSVSSGTMPDAVYAVALNNTQQIGYAYDGLGRMTTRTLSVPNKSYTYSYTPGGHGTNSTTTQVSSVTSGTDTTGYTYDSVGNITEIKENGVTVASYAYDTLNQLTSASHNGTSYSYTYDNNGNITSKTVGGVTTNYSYNDSSWADLLTGYGTDTITYDTIGNPLSYRDGYAFTWQRGRQLAGYTKGTDTASYTYDESGIRLSKTVNGNTTTFYVVDGTLLGQKFSDNKILQYLYDYNGVKYGFIYDGTTYFYDLNLQGDVIGIIDTSGNTVVSYAYDPWGKVLSVTGTLASTIGQINPIRYRGYYFDNETGFYYLQSRYYDTETGRFINADSQLNVKDGILGFNMFAYCNNNPIKYADPDGHSIILTCIIVGAVIGAAIGGYAGAKISKAKTGKVNGWAVAGGIIGGGIVGGLVGWGVGAAITAVGAATTGAAVSTASPIVEKAAEKVSQIGSSNTVTNVVETGKNVYYQVTSFQAIEQMKSTLQLKPIESAYNYVMTYQPTLAQAQNLGCRSLETVVRFSTNYSSFIPDPHCSVPGAMMANTPGVIRIMEDIVEVGFK